MIKCWIQDYRIDSSFHPADPFNSSGLYEQVLRRTVAQIKLSAEINNGFVEHNFNQPMVLLTEEEYNNLIVNHVIMSE